MGLDQLALPIAFILLAKAGPQNSTWEASNGTLVQRSISFHRYLTSLVLSVNPSSLSLSLFRDHIKLLRPSPHWSIPHPISCSPRLRPSRRLLPLRPPLHPPPRPAPSASIVGPSVPMHHALHFSLLAGINHKYFIIHHRRLSPAHRQFITAAPSAASAAAAISFPVY